MNRVDRAFRDARECRAGVLIPYLCPASPDRGELAALLPRVERAGAGVIEIGIPYSDPIADGPVIAAAMHRALVAGVTPEVVFAQVAAARDKVEAGLVAMVSVSLVLASGVGAFVARARDAGFDGFIFPDAPLEESGDLLAAAGEAGMTASLLVAPTTPPPRAAEIAAASSGFVYLLARTGITGERAEAPDVGPRVAALRPAARVPIACGFGISSAGHVAAVVRAADGAIVGSALVRRMDQARERGEDPARAAEEFVTELSTGLYQSPGG